MSARAVLVEVRLGPATFTAEQVVDALLPAGATRDDDYEPVPMDRGRTWLVRCVIADASSVEILEAHPDVVGVWPDSPIAPM